MPIETDIEQLNSEIEGWNKSNLEDLRKNISSLNIKHVKRSPNKVSLQKALKSSLRKRTGVVDRISYSMPRSAIFLAKGVSRGHPISNPRASKNWYAPVVNKNIEELGDIVANGAGNLIINNISIK